MSAQALAASRAQRIRIPFHATYPAGHEIAGVVVERGRECGCGRWFQQFGINRDWLEAIGKSQRESFLQSCEVIRKADDSPRFVAWHPQRCHKCARRQL